MSAEAFIATPAIVPGLFVVVDIHRSGVELAGHRLGLAYDQDFVGTVTLGRLKIPARWRRRFQLDRYVNIEGKP